MQVPASAGTRTIAHANLRKGATLGAGDEFEIDMPDHCDRNGMRHVLKASPRARNRQETGEQRSGQDGEFDVASAFHAGHAPGIEKLVRRRSMA